MMAHLEVKVVGGFCKGCKWWGNETAEMRRGVAEDEQYLPESFGKRYCTMTYTFRGEPPHKTLAEASGIPTGILYTAPDFGCVQYEPSGHNSR